MLGNSPATHVGGFMAKWIIPALIPTCSAFVATAVLCSCFTQSLDCVHKEPASAFVCEEAVLPSLKLCTLSVSVAILQTALVVAKSSYIFSSGSCHVTKALALFS